MTLSPQIIELIDPCLELSNGNRVFTTLEGENPGGSMKDHLVRGEIESLLKAKKIKKGGGISEVSAGSTAASLAHYCPEYDLKCVLFVPAGVPDSLVKELRQKGATVYLENMDVIYENYNLFMEKNSDLVKFNQLFDSKKRRHYRSLGSAIRQQIGAIDAIIGGVGTGHSLLGTAEGLNAPMIISAEPEPALKISGIRNIVSTRYGHEDYLNPQYFDDRIIVSEGNLPEKNILLTSSGPVQVGSSFAVVIGALQSLLQNRKNQTIFALGGTSKRVPAEILRRVA